MIGRRRLILSFRLARSRSPTSAVSARSLSQSSRTKPPQSTLDDLRALRQTVTNERDARRLDDALRDLTRALDPSLWVDPTHLRSTDGERVFNQSKDAVIDLRELLRDERRDERRANDERSASPDRGRYSSALPAATARFYIDRILDVDRRLAFIAINDARTAGANQ